jgi:transposase-like protein
MSVARVAQAEGVNSHQVFQWRQAYWQGALGDSATGAAALLPVVVSESGRQTQEPCGESAPAASSGAIHIDLPGRAMITAENGANVVLLRVVLDSLLP